MCAVSMISDHYMNKFTQGPISQPPIPSGPQFGGILTASVSRQEFDELKREILEMKELLKRAVEYDERTGQPDCQMEEKIAMLRKIADVVGVSLDDVFKREKRE